MTRPRRYLLRMALFLAAVIAVVALLSPGLSKAFLHNPALNGLIMGVLMVGILLNFRQVISLYPEVAWIESYRRSQPTLSNARPPRLLSALATMLGERRDRISLSAPALRSLLDGISSRLDEARDISRYFTGLLIFLGLLGTFWGLSQTVGSIGDVIRNLTIVGDDVSGAFDSLKQGLEAPLTGMGTAFGASMFGLGGSLVLGFLDLQSSQAQNAFYNDLEEWLSGQTRLGSSVSTAAAEGDPTVPAYIQALLEQTADSLNSLQRVISRGEESRINANNNIRALTDKLATLTDQMRTEQSLIARLAESQLELKPVLVRLAESNESAVDEATRGHVRNVDVALTRLIEELAVGRDEVIREMRSEFKMLARTISAIAESVDEPGR
ncbi:MAG: flagellar motor protein MotA [Rhodospirillales bacterium]|nr:flagellar motor protein MotA [Rhodospirillales bacterium]